MNLAQSIKKKARDLGFDLVGLAPARVDTDAVDFFNLWLDCGYGATMEWLKKNRSKRGDPTLVLDGAKTVICCGMNYYAGTSPGWISNYAWGEDYHEILRERLKILETHILEIEPGAKLKSYSDTGPLLERSMATQAGLGWVGKNTCLINKKIGSFFFLGEILTDLDLDVDLKALDHCGKCTRCLDACPTQALQAYHLDASRCIAYLTIEHRGEINSELASKMGHHVVGCDICQDVCPWNQGIPLTKEAAFYPRPENYDPDLEMLGKITETQFGERFSRSPIKRVKWKGLVRNIEIAQKNQK